MHNGRFLSRLHEISFIFIICHLFRLILPRTDLCCVIYFALLLFSTIRLVLQLFIPVLFVTLIVISGFWLSLGHPGMQFWGSGVAFAPGLLLLGGDIRLGEVVQRVLSWRSLRSGSTLCSKFFAKTGHKLARGAVLVVLSRRVSSTCLLELLLGDRHCFCCAWCSCTCCRSVSWGILSFLCFGGLFGLGCLSLAALLATEEGLVVVLGDFSLYKD